MGYIAIKSDIEKAYGRLEGDFIKSCLIDLGFCDMWTNWVMQA